MSVRRGRRWLSLLLLVALPACREAPPAGPRTVLFAVDGLEWSVVRPLLEAGRMPTLARLIATGSYGRLETMEPTYSPVIWTTIATGRLPAEHGISGFEHRTEAGTRVLFNGLDRREPAFWNILSARGRSVQSVGWWLTHPVEPVNGVMVAQTNTAKRADVQSERGIRKGSLIAGAAGQVFPEAREGEFFEIAEQVEADLDERMRAVFGAAIDAADPQATTLFRASVWALRADAIYAEIARRLAREPADLLAVYFGGSDVVGHRFWRFHEPDRFRDRPSPASIAALGGVIADYYVYLDARIGEIVEACAPGSRFFVVADHGMEAYRTEADFPPGAKGKALLSGHHFEAQAGVFVAAGPGIRRMGPLEAGGELGSVGSVVDLLPTLLAVLGLPRAEDMPGEPMAAVLAPELLAGQPAPVATYADEDWRAERARRVVAGAPTIDRQRIQQLRELGYIE